MRALMIALLVSAFAFAGANAADPKPELPIEVTLSGKETKFTLDLGGKTPEEYAKALKETKGRPMPAPAVEFLMKVTNTSKEKITVWQKGDPVVLDLELKGKGAVNVMPLLPMTLEFRLPVPVELDAGKSMEFTVKSLVSGFRGVSKFSYWTDAGEYELVASFKTGISPAPKGSMVQEGFGIVTATSKPLKLTVELKK